MFRKRKDTATQTLEPGEAKLVAKPEKLPGPRELPGIVEKYLVQKTQKDPESVRTLRVVIRRRQDGEKTFNIRVFDDNLTSERNVKVKDFTTFDSYPELLLYEGWYDEKAKKVELEEKEGLKLRPKVTIFSEKEIVEQIKGLTQPGSTVFFYLGGWAQRVGGPLGRGAAIVELNSNYPGKKQRKYIMYLDDVNDQMEFAGKREKQMTSDDTSQIASWIKQYHEKPAW